MSLDIIKIRRKSFDAETMQVTPLNINDVAKWCNGTVKHDGDKEGNLSRDYIKVRVAFPINIAQTEAHIGDYVVKQKRTFKVYKDKAARGTFELRNGQPLVSAHDPQVQQPVKNTGPNPGQMPKKRAPEPALADDSVAVQTAVDDVNKQIDNPNRARSWEEVKAEAEAVKQISNPEAAQAARTEEAGGITSEDLHASPAPVSTDVLDGNAKVVADEEEPKSMTLDELNDQVGDPRTAQEIMAEDLPTPGEVFRGEA